jgi:hypothetical protein
MAANKFVVKHREIEVEYTSGLTPGIPAQSTVTAVPPPESFTEAEITADETAHPESVRSIVEVALSG